MLIYKRKQAGFTLIEMAIVLIIIGVVLGSLVGALSSRVEQSKRKQTQVQLQEIKKALIGFAMANGRLPCPALATSGGVESPDGGGNCTTDHGFVPSETLGLYGAYNLDNLLTDSWNNPIRYSVTNANANAMTTAGGMRATTMAVLSPNILICSSQSLNGSSCPAGTKLVDTIPFILLSLGQDGNTFIGTPAPNSDQGENASETNLTANAGGENLAYTVANNRIFVSRDYGEEGSAGGRFDDIVDWMSIYELYTYLIQTGQLP